MYCTFHETISENRIGYHGETKCNFQADKTNLAVSPLVVVRPQGRVRISIYTSVLNKQMLRRHFPLHTIDDIAAILDCKKGP